MISRTREHISHKKIINKTRDLVYMAICTALICICSWITIPGTIPFTLQTLAIFITLGLLGWKKGTISILIYIILGIIGLPVFSYFNSGIGAILGPTGGYIIGFIFAGLIYGILSYFIKNENVLNILGFISGLLICYLIGTIWFYYVYSANNSISFVSVIMMCVIPFIAPDILKILLAIFVVKNVKKRLNF